ncbi:MAG: TadE family protein [Candidatus Melainabacteria bacterium]|nr:TadE family protein [Candidatus Melainabacteria bacterium]
MQCFQLVDGTKKRLAQGPKQGDRPHRPLKRSLGKRACNRAWGQNIAELALTLPMVVVAIFATVEFGRAWQAYQAAKMAALDGAYTAAMYQNTGAGTLQISRRLLRANLIPLAFGVQAFDNDQAYQARVTTMFRPAFAGLNVNVFGNNIQIIPNAFPISYESTRFYSVM